MPQQQLTQVVIIVVVKIAASILAKPVVNQRTGMRVAAVCVQAFRRLGIVLSKLQGVFK